MWTPPKDLKRTLSYRDFTNTISQVMKKESAAKDINDLVVGIEIENETKADVLLPTLRGWNRVAEHSLRHCGFEYVSKPMRHDRVPDALANLFESLHNIPMTNSPRTSTHIHFDVGHMNFLQLINFSCLYWMLEPCLESFVGNHRSGNHFCLRIKDTSVAVMYLTEAVKTGMSYGSAVFYDHLRYSSLNFASIAKFGTLEFRLLRGVDKAPPIVTWIRILKDIRDFSLRFKNPKELNDFFLNGINLDNLPNAVLSPLTRSCIEEPLGPIDREVYLVIQDLLVSHDTFDWTKEILLEEEALRKKAEEEERIRKLTIFTNTVIPESIFPQDVLVEEDASGDYVELEENF